MRKAGDILRAILDESKIDEAKTYSSFFRSWSKIVGQDLAAHSRVRDIQNAIVLVEADHPGWLQMIQFRRKQILQKIRQQYPELSIRDLRFFLGNQPDNQTGAITGEAQKNREGGIISPPEATAAPAEGLAPEAVKGSQSRNGYREFQRLLEQIRARKGETGEGPPPGTEADSDSGLG